MSSGNPFRRSTQQPASVTPPSTLIDYTEDGGYNQEEVGVTNFPLKTKKVRITSPPRSPPQPASPIQRDDTTQRFAGAQFSGSSSPVSKVVRSELPAAPVDDPFSKVIELREEETDDERLIRNPGGGSSALESGSIATVVPSNPFQNTLATLEPAAAPLLSGGERNGSSYRGTADKAGTGSSRGAMDVDSFKRLLMTGSTIPSVPESSSTITTPQRIHSGLTIDSSSSTDTSSVSRQSIFEPIQEAHPESPRTSYEISLSDDDERSSLMGDIRKSEKKKKPPPPKHRHGKLVSLRGPQTVSFSDFAPSFSSSNPPTPIRADVKALHRTPSDLNKPLPPPPPVSTSPEPLPPKDDVSQQGQSATAVPELDQPSPTQKRAPPPVPLARRHSQLKSSTAQSRSRSSSALTASSLGDSPHPSPSISESATPTPKPPPPPPTRRTGNPSTSANTHSQTDPSPSPTISRSSSIKAPPPPPSRTPSTSHRPSPGSAQPSMAPRPPPPRRGSSRSSMDTNRPAFNTSPTETRRTSAELRRVSQDSGDRRPSGASASSLQREVIAEQDVMDHEAHASRVIEEESSSLPPPQVTGNEILADMDALQREVDALRGVHR